MKAKQKFNNVMSIVFLILGVLTCIYFIYAVFVSCGYIGNLASAKSITVGKDFGKIAQYIMTNSFSYLFYGLILLYLGWNTLSMHKEERVKVVDTMEEEASKEE